VPKCAKCEKKVPGKFIIWEGQKGEAPYYVCQEHYNRYLEDFFRDEEEEE